MKFLFLIHCLALVGCTSIKERAETSGTNRVTTIHIQTLFDAKAVVDKIRASNGATHSLGAQGVSEESSSKVVETLAKGFEGMAKGIVEGFMASSGLPPKAPSIPSTVITPNAPSK